MPQTKHTGKTTWNKAKLETQIAILRIGLRLLNTTFSTKNDTSGHQNSSEKCIVHSKEDILNISSDINFQRTSLSDHYVPKIMWI